MIVTDLEELLAKLDIQSCRAFMKERSGDIKLYAWNPETQLCWEPDYEIGYGKSYGRTSRVDDSSFFERHGYTPISVAEFSQKYDERVARIGKNHSLCMADAIRNGVGGSGVERGVGTGGGWDSAETGGGCGTWGDKGYF